jgi:hypothetical protein
MKVFSIARLQSVIQSIGRWMCYQEPGDCLCYPSLKVSGTDFTRFWRCLRAAAGIRARGRTADWHGNIVARTRTIPRRGPDVLAIMDSAASPRRKLAVRVNRTYPVLARRGGYAAPRGFAQRRVVAWSIATPVRGISHKLSGVFDGLRARGALKESDVTEALREVRVALLDGMRVPLSRRTPAPYRRSSPSGRGLANPPFPDRSSPAVSAACAHHREGATNLHGCLITLT